MADDAKAEPTTPAPAPKPTRARKKPAAAEPKPAETPKADAPKGPKAPRRPTLDARSARLLKVRDDSDVRRPKFVRQAAHRYWRIGRDGAWRRPRGLQSKQRRHYGYRSEVVSVGYRSPRGVRGRTPTGFRPVLVSTTDDLQRLSPTSDAVVIARTVGTRRRLVLEEAVRKLGLHLLNPIAHDEREE